MSMKNFLDWSEHINTLHRIEEQRRIEEAVRNSKLTPEQKDAAFKDLHRSKAATIILVCIIVCILAAAVIIDSNNGFQGFIFSLAAIPAALVIMLIYAIFAGKKFSNWHNSVTLVMNNFDGLTPEQIQELAPRDVEKHIIKSYHIKSIIAAIIGFSLAAVALIITFSLGVPIVSGPNFIILIIILAPVMIYIDNNDVEVRRLRSGYYKRQAHQTIGFSCPNCGRPISIQSSELNTSSPTTTCPACHETVPVSPSLFQGINRDYEKYLRKIQKIQNKNH